MRHQRAHLVDQLQRVGQLVDFTGIRQGKEGRVQDDNIEQRLLLAQPPDARKKSPVARSPCCSLNPFNR